MIIPIVSKEKVIEKIKELSQKSEFLCSIFLRSLVEQKLFFPIFPDLSEILPLLFQALGRRIPNNSEKLMRILLSRLSIYYTKN